MIRVVLLLLLFSIHLNAMLSSSSSFTSETDSDPGTPTALRRSTGVHSLAYNTVYGGPTSVMSLRNDTINTPVLGRARRHLPTRTPLSRSISTAHIKYGPTQPLRLNDPRLEEYVRLIIYENDRDEDGIRYEAMRVLIGIKIFRFPRERIVRVTTRSTGATFDTLQTMQVIGLP